MRETDKLRCEPWLGRIIDKKYKLVSPLGLGGMAMVFLAERLHLRDNVAIKVLQPRTSSDNDIMRRFQVEAAAAAKVKHPNVVTIYDFGITEDRVVYIVMELLEGPGLDQEMHRCGMLPISRMLEIMQPVCSAISAAHSVGLLHRDIKPPNIILHRGRYDISEVVKVVDFGIAKFFESHDLVVRTSEGVVLGTAEYMSPEQCQGFPLDARSDVYSLAMVCYQMLSGKLPFQAPSTAEFLIKHVREAPLPLRKFARELPVEIEEIVMRSLCKNPKQRPAGALEFYNLLEQAAGQANAIQLSEALLPLQSGTIGKPSELFTPAEVAKVENVTLPAPKFNAFSSRGAELARLIEAWHAACLGEGRPLLLMGEPGVGKTRLLEEFARRVGETGAFVFQGRFYQKLGLHSFHVMIIELKNFFLNLQSKPDEMNAIFGARADTIMQQLNMIWQANGLVDQISNNDNERQLQYFNALAQAFALLSRRRPVMLALDDLHWADDSAREFLSYLKHTIARERLLIVAAARPSGDDGSFKDWLKTFQRDCDILSLTNFNKQQAFEALEAIFGRVALSEQQFSTLLAESGGNPYFLVELLRLLLNEDRIKYDGKSWIFHDLSFTVPAAIVNLIELMMEKMAAEARRVFASAAVIGEEFDFDLLLHLAKMDEEATQAVIDRGIDSSLVSALAKPDRYRFNNSIIRRVLYDGLNKRARRRTHRAIADWLIVNRGDAAIYEMAYHYFEAGELAQAFDYAVKAADYAHESLQIGEMRKYLNWAEKCLEAFAELRKLENGALAGKWPDDEIGQQRVRRLANYRWLCGLSLVHRGLSARAEPQLHQAVKLARLFNNSKLLGQIYGALGMNNTGKGAKGEAIDYFKQALDYYRRAGYLEGQSQTLRNMSALYEQRGDYTLALDCASAAVEVARACGNRTLESFSLSTEAWMLCKLRRFDESALVAKKALALARKARDQAARCACYNTIAQIYSEQGLYQDAVHPRREAMRISRLLGNRRFEMILTGNLAEIYFHLGKYSEAENYFLKVLKLLETGGNQYFEQNILQHLVRICIRQEKLPQARAYLTRAEALSATVDLLEPRCEFHAVAAELLFMEGKNREAIQEADQAIEQARSLGNLEHEWQPWLIKARALVAMGRGRQAKEALAKSIAVIERAAAAITDPAVREKYLAYQDRQFAFELRDHLNNTGANAAI